MRGPFLILFLAITLGVYPAEGLMAQSSCLNLDYVNFSMDGALCRHGLESRCLDIDAQSSEPDLSQVDGLPQSLCLWSDPHLPSVVQIELRDGENQRIALLEGSMDAQGRFEALPVIWGEWPQAAEGSCALSLYYDSHISLNRTYSFMGELEAQARLLSDDG